MGGVLDGFIAALVGHWALALITIALILCGIEFMWHGTDTRAFKFLVFVFLGAVFIAAAPSIAAIVYAAAQRGWAG